jgi:hypothetical protein
MQGNLLNIAYLLYVLYNIEGIKETMILWKITLRPMGGRIFIFT